MIVGRTFNREHFAAFVMERPIVRKAAVGLVFLDAKERAAILTAQTLATLGSRLSALGLAQPCPQVARALSRTAKEELLALRAQKLPPRTLLSALKALGYRPGAVEQE